jgi:hypothetical protein
MSRRKRSTKKRLSEMFPSYGGSKDINHYFRTAHGRVQPPSAGATADQKRQAGNYMNMGMYYQKGDFFQESAKLISSWHSDLACVTPMAIFQYNISEGGLQLEKNYPLSGSEMRAQCANKPLIVIPVRLYGKKDNIKKNSTGHLNLLLVNQFLNTIEHFEPHGHTSGVAEWKELDALTNSVLSDFALSMFPEYEWIERKQMCPLADKNNRPQINRDEGGYEDYGFCQIWGLWYLNLRLSAPHILPNMAWAAALKKIRTKNKFIMDFGIYLMTHYVVTFNL